MFWFLLFLGVVVVWLLVLALLAKKLWGQTKALTREFAAAQSKLEAAQRSDAGSSRTGSGARSRA
jgi:cell division protein FtsB